MLLPLPLLLLFLPRPTLCQQPSSTPIPPPAIPCPLELSLPMRLVNSFATDLPLYTLSAANLGPLPCLGIPITRFHLITSEACMFPSLTAIRGDLRLPILSATASASLAVLRHSPVSPAQSTPFLVNMDINVPIDGQMARAIGRHNVSGVVTGEAGFVDVVIASTARCRMAVDSNNFTSRTICAGKRRCGTCTGDGGAALVQLSDENEPVIVGIGQVVTRCGAEGLDVYEVVAEYLGWMMGDLRLRLRRGKVAGVAPSVTEPIVIETVGAEPDGGSMMPVPTEVIEGVGGEKSGGFWGVVAVSGACVVTAVVTWLVWKKGGWEKLWVGGNV